MSFELFRESLRCIEDGGAKLPFSSDGDEPAESGKPVSGEDGRENEYVDIRCLEGRLSSAVLFRWARLSLSRWIMACISSSRLAISSFSLRIELRSAS